MSIFSISPENEFPIFPHTLTDFPALLRIFPINDTTVDFPLVPVTATMGPLQKRNPSSSSLIMGMLFFSAYRIGKDVLQTPGLTNMISVSARKGSVCFPISSSMNFFSKRAAFSLMSFESLFSVTETIAPSLSRRVALSKPLFPKPTTVIFLFRRSIIPPTYMSFNVAMPKSARMMAIIQKRIVTLGSGHPFNWK